MKNRVKSFLMIGQSNMAGRGYLHEVKPIINERIFMLRNGRWQMMAEPINCDRSVAGISLAASFADAWCREYKEGKIGLFTEQDTAEETESTTIPVTKICLEYYIDETADGITYRPVWSFRCPYQWKDSPDEQELFYIDGETGALIRDAFGW